LIGAGLAVSEITMFFIAASARHACAKALKCLKIPRLS
jgi:hypothetical protein